MKQPLAKIAAEIGKYLKAFENDPKINPRSMKKPSKYYEAGAFASGRWIYVCYIGYQGTSNLTRSEAEAYLKWLDAGNVGKHYELST